MVLTAEEKRIKAEERKRRSLQKLGLDTIDPFAPKTSTSPKPSVTSTKPTIDPFTKEPIIDPFAKKPVDVALPIIPAPTSRTSIEGDRKITVEESRLGFENLSPERQAEIEGIRRGEAGVSGTGVFEPSGSVTQDQIDELRKAGINVFSPRVLKALSEQDIIAKKGFDAGKQELIDLLLSVDEGAPATEVGGLVITPEEQAVIDKFNTGEKLTPEEASLFETEHFKQVLEARAKGQLTEMDISDKVVQAIGVGGSAILLGVLGWQVLGTGGGLFATKVKAVQSGTAVKNSGTMAKLGSGLLKYGALLVGFDILKGAINPLSKVDEQQQALNTMGQTASTIVGDSTSGAGDPIKGLRELQNNLEILSQLEKDIKQGTIKSLVLNLSGKITDLNADILDQRLTTLEGIRDIRAFIARGVFPEMTDHEVQFLFRQLEEEGIIEPVDLTTARRPVTQEALAQ